MADNPGESSYIQLTANIVSAYVSNNTVPSAEIPNLIGQIHSALLRVSGGQAPTPAEPLKPAVPLKRSITSDYLVCLEDGKFKSLKRHLRTQYSTDAGAVSREMGPAAGLPDGGAELRRGAIAIGQADGPSASSAGAAASAG
jgi:predicted transcriptional regulator